jgi:hypothetical protein
MKTNRRNFLRASTASLYAAGITSKVMANTNNETTMQLSCLDYGLSFITNSGPENQVRFWVESTTKVIDEKTGISMDFYQCGSCKSEHTFAKTNLFQENNYDFLPILAGDQWLVFRRLPGFSDRYRKVHVAKNIAFGKPILKTLRPAAKVTLLPQKWEAIAETTAAGIPIVAQTELYHQEMGLRAILEYPVKTMNISVPKKMYQVDTGPVAFPDLTIRPDRLVDCISLAFVAFNSPHAADFVTEQLTPVDPNDPESPQTYHYSNPFSLPAKNRLLAVAIPE